MSFGNEETFSFFLSNCEKNLSEILGQLDSFLDCYIGSKVMTEFLYALLYLSNDTEFLSAIENDESLIPYVTGCISDASENQGFIESDPARLLLLILLYVTKYYIDSPLVKETINSWKNDSTFSNWISLAKDTLGAVRPVKYRNISEMTPLPQTKYYIDGQNHKLKTAFSDRRFLSYFSEFCAMSFCDGISTFTPDSLSAYFEAIINAHNLTVFADAFLEDVTKNLKINFQFSDHYELLTVMKKEGDSYYFSHHQIQEYFTA